MPRGGPRLRSFGGRTATWHRAGWRSSLSGALALAFEPQRNIRVRMNRGRQRLPLGLLDHPSAMAGSARSTAHLAVLLIAFAFLGHILAGGNDALVFCPVVVLSDGGRHFLRCCRQGDIQTIDPAARYAIGLPFSTSAPALLRPGPLDPLPISPGWRFRLPVCQPTAWLLRPDRQQARRFAG